MFSQTHRVSWTSSVFAVLSCYVLLVLLNVHTVSSMSIDRLGLERKGIQQSSFHDARSLMKEDQDGFLVDEDRQLTPVMTHEDEVADMYVLSPAIDGNTIDFDMNLPNGENDMLMVESSVVPSIEPVHEILEQSTEVENYTQDEEGNSNNAEENQKTNSVFKNNSPSIFETIVVKDINNKNNEEPILSLTQTLENTNSNIEEKPLISNTNTDETPQITINNVNNIPDNVNKNIETILDTVVEVLDDAMTQFGKNNCSTNQINTEVVDTNEKLENFILNQMDNVTDFQGKDNALFLVEEATTDNQITDEENIFENNSELSDKLEKEILDNNNETILVTNQIKENEFDKNSSESDILNITENIENLDENFRNDISSQSVENPSTETGLEKSTELLQNFEDIPDNFEGQTEKVVETNFTDSSEPATNEEIVVKLESPEIESGTIKTGASNFDRQENLDIVHEDAELITEKTFVIESETDITIATETATTEVSEKQILDIDEADSMEAIIKPQILNKNDNKPHISSLNQFEHSHDEEAKPPSHISLFEIKPINLENIQDENKQTSNVIDSVLNYVNASFIQNNEKEPIEKLKDQEESENDFKPSQRSYEGSQVWRIVVQSVKERKMADELLTKYDGQLWKEVNQEVDYLLKPQALYAAEKHIIEANLSRIVLIDNLQSIIDVENPPAEEIAQLQNRKGHRLTWQAYHRLEDIHGFFDYLAKTYPDICSVETIGYSVEKRPLKIIKISNGNVGNPGIWIDGGMHAREWISPASVTYIANQIVEGWDDLPVHMKNVNWHIHAVANPDGYEYSHTTDRLWRKNMRSHGRDCPGVDLNRNFGYMWGGKGTSANPCSQIYRGNKAFSEPETFYISKYISNLPRGTFSGYLSFHSYGQYILYPWGYDYALTQDKADLDRVARQAGTEITKSTGGKYTVGTSATTLYPAAGGSDDWAKGFAGIKYSYTIEMGDTGRYGFILPSQFIEYNGKDAYTFAETVAQAVIQEQILRLRGF